MVLLPDLSSHFVSAQTRHPRRGSTSRHGTAERCLDARGPETTDLSASATAVTHNFISYSSKQDRTSSSL
jgi:hypothetical protein